MDVRLLLWVSLTVALVTTVGTGLTGFFSKINLSYHFPPAWARQIAFLLPPLGLMVTMPSRPPFFAAGHGLGYGWFIGGFGALVLMGLSARRGDSESDSGGAAFALPAIAVAIPLLFLRPVLLDALIGTALGWFACCAILILSKTEDTSDRIVRSLVFSTVVMTTLAAAAVLGTLRDPRTAELARGTWAAAAVAICACGGLVRFALGLTRTAESRARRAISPVVGVGLLALLGLLAATRIVADIRLFSALIAGLLLWPVVVWVYRSGISSDSSKPDIPLLPMLLIAGGFVLAGQLLLGYGSAIFTLGLILSAALLQPSIRPSDIEKATPAETGEVRLLLFGVALSLFRLTQGRWSGDFSTTSILADHYAILGLLAGVAAPILITRKGERYSLLRIAAAGLLTIAVPAALVVLFGSKCVLPVLIGCALGGILGDGIAPALLAIGIGLIVSQLLGHALPLADLTRSERTKVLALVVGLTAAAVLGGGWFGKRREEVL